MIQHHDHDQSHVKNRQCFMCNHFHVLLEVTPRPLNGLTDDELLGRLRWLQAEAQVEMVAKELAEARKVVAEGRAKEGEAYVEEIHSTLSKISLAWH